MKIIELKKSVRENNPRCKVCIDDKQTFDQNHIQMQQTVYIVFVNLQKCLIQY